ncbi:MAG: hypothetical protein KIT22_04315 [Verrucomicrobiae bacterium]|nr:hypothetical protein [Verrucomicrobiae bacterium]
MPPQSQLPRIALLAALLCGGWWIALKFLPKPALAETNYEANRLREERWLLGPKAPAALVGTSISGRLLPDYFEGTPLAGLANLGLDGASPHTGLRLAAMRPDAVPLVLLEVQKLSMLPGPNDRQLLDLASGVGLRVSEWLPLTRAEARPSTVLYAWLKERREGGGSGADPATPRSETSTNAAAEPPLDWRPRIRAAIDAVQQSGARVILVRLPAGRANPADPELPNEADATAREFGLPLVDLLRLSRKEGLSMTYTDGLHLTPPSARAVSQLLVRALQAEGLLPERR